MAIITPSARVWRFFVRLLCCAVTAPAVFAQQAGNQGLSFASSINANVIHQSIAGDNLGTLNINTLQVRPDASALFRSRHIEARVNASVTHLERSGDEFQVQNTFPEISYTLLSRFFDDRAYLRANGAFRYQNAFAGNFLVNNFLNNQGELVKMRTNQIAAGVNVLQNDWLNGQAELSYALVESERNPFFQGIALDNEIIASRMLLTQGDRVQSMSWRVQGTFQKADRVQGIGAGVALGARGGVGFATRNLLADLDVGIIGDWAFRFTAQHEANQFGNGQVGNGALLFQNSREFNTYGAGVTYRQRPDRFISVTYNQVDTVVIQEQQDNFVGVDLNWAFSPRTSVQARYTRRFFGESANADIRYNARRWRGSLRYTETVTNNAFLLAENQSNGVFVCPTGDTNLANCFQPASLDYQPSVDEQLVELFSQNLELNDNIIIRKALTSQLGFDLSRVRVGFSNAYSEETLVTQDGVRRTITGGVNLGYDLGAFTNINASITYAQIDQRISGTGVVFGGFFGGSGKNENINTRLQIRRTIGRQLSANAAFDYIERQGDIGFGLFGANFTDRRVSVGVSYRFNQQGGAN